MFHCEKINKVNVLVCSQVNVTVGDVSRGGTIDVDTGKNILCTFMIKEYKYW